MLCGTDNIFPALGLNDLRLLDDTRFIMWHNVMPDIPHIQTQDDLLDDGGEIPKS